MHAHIKVDLRRGAATLSLLRGVMSVSWASWTNLQLKNAAIVHPVPSWCLVTGLRRYSIVNEPARWEEDRSAEHAHVLRTVFCEPWLRLTPLLSD